ncbi:MAG TPA: hypothetical protein VGN00_24925 [Puia sp.]|jgi:hypothetical protein
MKKKLYRLHRKLSIIIAIPVFLWASSGFMHPLMTNIRPAIATQGWPAAAVDSSRLQVSLVAALRMHHLDSFANVRLVHIDTNWFYQVQPVRTVAAATSPAIHPAVPIYLSCTNGNVLPAGDWLYAQYLARHFLEGGKVRGEAASSIQVVAAPVHVVLASAHVAPAETVPDCCGAATECVLNPARGAKVANVSLLNGYDNEYKSINRLLPVYRVSFDRPDGIRIYVETTQDRFSFAMDNRRAVFDEIFRLFHTWGWLDGLGKGRIAVELSFALLAFCTVLLGICLFFSTRAAKAKNNPLVRTRRYHRYTAIFASLFTLFWSFSGGYHALTKLISSEDVAGPVPANFAAAGTGFDYSRLQAAVARPITNLSLAKIGGQVYWRVSLQQTKANGPQDPVKDLMKDGKASFAPVAYVNATDYSVLPEGDRRYAADLACRFSGQSLSAVESVTPVTAFNDEYNFIDKRLPVWRVGYPGAGNPRYYVETSSGQLAAFMNNAAYAEGYSFAFFHKHHFMDWAGKTVRDGSTMFWAVIQVLMVTIGLILYFRFRK